MAPGVAARATGPQKGGLTVSPGNGPRQQGAARPAGTSGQNRIGLRKRGRWVPFETMTQGPPNHGCDSRPSSPNAHVFSLQRSLATRQRFPELATVCF
ncbi:hypothetical protein MRX96_031276 [Rhipicephalus microplus]